MEINDNDVVELTFEVTCSTNICMLDHSPENTYESKVDQFVHDCEEAMECDMRHWGDFNYFIDCVRDKLIDYDGSESGNIKIDNDYRGNAIENPNIQKLLKDYLDKFDRLSEEYYENKRPIEPETIKPLTEELIKNILKL